VVQTINFFVWREDFVFRRVSKNFGWTMDDNNSIFHLPYSIHNFPDSSSIEEASVIGYGQRPRDGQSRLKFADRSAAEY